MNKLQLEETIKKILKEEWNKKLLEAKSFEQIATLPYDQLDDDEFTQRLEYEDKLDATPDDQLSDGELELKMKYQRDSVERAEKEKEEERGKKPSSTMASVSKPSSEKPAAGKRDYSNAKNNPVLKINKDKKEFVQWVQKQFGKYLPKGANTSTNYDAVFNTLEQNMTGKMPIEKLAQMFLNRQSLKKQFDRQEALDQAREAKAKKAIEDELVKTKNRTGDMKLQQIANKFDISRERVRQIEMEAMTKLQKKFGIKFLKDIKGKEHPEFGKVSSLDDDSEQKLDKISTEIDEKIDRAAILFAKFIKATEGNAAKLSQILDEKFNLFSSRPKPGETPDPNAARYVSPKIEQQTLRYLYKILIQAHNFENTDEPVQASEIENSEDSAFEFVVEYLVEDLNSEGYKYSMKTGELDSEGNYVTAPHPDDSETTVPMFRFFIDKVVKGDSIEAPEDAAKSDDGVIDFFESKSNNRRRTSK